MSLFRRLRIKFVPQDVWIGVYWEKPGVRFRESRKVYVCLIPCFPIIYTRRFK